MGQPGEGGDSAADITQEVCKSAVVVVGAYLIVSRWN